MSSSHVYQIPGNVSNYITSFFYNRSNYGYSDGMQQNRALTFIHNDYLYIYLHSYLIKTTPNFLFFALYTWNHDIANTQINFNSSSNGDVSYTINNNYLYIVRYSSGTNMY